MNHHYLSHIQRAANPSMLLLASHGFCYVVCAALKHSYNTKYAFDIFAVIIVKQLMLNS